MPIIKLAKRKPPKRLHQHEIGIVVVWISEGKRLQKKIAVLFQSLWVCKTLEIVNFSPLFTLGILIS
jgi:hypothetical protein